MTTPRTRWTLAVALAIGTALSAVAPAHAETKAEIMRIVIHEAEATRVPATLALAVAKVESDFNDAAKSVKGARGVMQIMPATAWGEYGVDPDELWDPKLNIQLGLDYLARLIERYNGRWDLALSAYNGGSAVDTPSGPRVMPATRDYVQQVLNWQRNYAEQATVWQFDRAQPQDGWTAARTQTATAVPGPAAPKPVAPQVAAVVAVPKATPVVPVFLQPAPIAGTFDERLLAARQRLDADFGPGLQQRLAGARSQIDAGGPGRRG